MNFRIACLALALIALPLDASQADQVNGTATYLQRMALPPHAVYDAHVQDVSRADTSAERIGSARIIRHGHRERVPRYITTSESMAHRWGAPRILQRQRHNTGPLRSAGVAVGGAQRSTTSLLVALGFAWPALRQLGDDDPYLGARLNRRRTIDSIGGSVVERALAERRNAIYRQ